MPTPVDYHPLAIREARRAERFYARARARARAGAGVRAGFVTAFRGAEARVAAQPALWTPDAYGTRACRLKKYPLRLVYVEQPTRVYVLAVAHDKRRPGYWRRRLPP